MSNTKSLIVAGLLALGLAACGDSGTQNVSTNTTPGNTTANVDQLKSEAEKLLADVATYIKEKKFDLADKAVARLEEIKSKVPAEYGPKIDQIKQALATAKTAVQRLPGLPGGN